MAHTYAFDKSAAGEPSAAIDSGTPINLHDYRRSYAMSSVWIKIVFTDGHSLDLFVGIDTITIKGVDVSANTAAQILASLRDTIFNNINVQP